MANGTKTDAALGKHLQRALDEEMERVLLGGRRLPEPGTLRMEDVMNRRYKPQLPWWDCGVMVDTTNS